MYNHGMNLPPSFVTTICNAFGEEGRAFLHNLPALLDEYAQRWELTLLSAFPHLSYNYVTPAVRRDASEAVLTLGAALMAIRPRLHVGLRRSLPARGAGRRRRGVRSRCLPLPWREVDADRAALLERLRPGALLRPLAFEDNGQHLVDYDASNPASGQDDLRIAEIMWSLHSCKKS